jgi:hypothetical protein
LATRHEPEHPLVLVGELLRRPLQLVERLGHGQSRLLEQVLPVVQDLVLHDDRDARELALHHLRADGGGLKVPEVPLGWRLAGVFDERVQVRVPLVLHVLARFLERTLHEDVDVGTARRELGRELLGQLVFAVGFQVDLDAGPRFEVLQQGLDRLGPGMVRPQDA